MAGETTLDTRRGLERIVVARLGHRVEWWTGFVVVLVASCGIDSIEWLLAWATMQERGVWWYGVFKLRVHGGWIRHSEQL